MNINRMCTNVQMSGAHKKSGLPCALVEEVEGGLNNIRARKTNLILCFNFLPYTHCSII